jgi:hypothetical protein
MLRRTLPKGTVIKISIDVEFLELDQKAKTDFSDLRVIYSSGGRCKEVPYIFKRGLKKGHYILIFPLQSKIKSRVVDEGYYLYYGSPGASRVSYKGEIFAFYEDFNQPVLDTKRISIDPLIKYNIDKGRIWIKGVLPSADAKKGYSLGLFHQGMPTSFCLSFEISFQARVVRHPGMFRASLVMGLVERGKIKGKLEDKIKGLIARLNAPDLEVREKATHRLIKIGPSALKLLQRALRESKSQEVLWRIGYILSQIRGKYIRSQVSLSVTGNVSGGMANLELQIGGRKRKLSHVCRLDGTKYRVIIRKDSKGRIEIMWGGLLLLKGKHRADLSSVCFIFAQNTRVSPIISLDNIALTPYGSYAPATEIMTEEGRD